MMKITRWFGEGGSYEKSDIHTQDLCDVGTIRVDSSGRDSGD